jgi:hypothetical protein
MKFATFSYKDLKGKETFRKLLVLESPTNKFNGIDVSEESDEDIAMFAVEYDFLHSEFLGKVEALKAQYDLKHNFRQFLESGVSDMEVTII